MTGMISQGPQQSISVLLIDDDPSLLEVLRELLAEIGVTEVATASNGQQGIEAYGASSIKPDLIICDLHMPGMDGVEVLRELSLMNCTSAIVVASGAGDSITSVVERSAQQRKLNFIGKLPKPFDEVLLAQLVDKARMETFTARRTRAMPKLDADDLASAIQNGHVVAYVQPQIDLQTEGVSGFEILARWQHAELGLVPPGIFIPIAEQHGLITLLTDVVLRNALESICRQTDRIDSNRQLSISMNLCVDSLAEPTLPAIIRKTLESCGFPAAQLVIELTESRLLSESADSLDALSRMRLMGLGLSIDDFGTGFSTLEQLANLPLTELKIDRSFVSGIHTQPRSQAIVRSSIAMARELNLHVVAEGIEKHAEWQAVKDLGATFAQGYLIAKPFPVAELSAWRESWQGLPASIPTL